MKKLNKKGFTLIEMLVVIAIIAILVSIIVPVVGNSTTKAAAATNAANLRSVAAEVAIKHLEDPVNVPAGEYTAVNGKLTIGTAELKAPVSKSIKDVVGKEEMKVVISGEDIIATYNGVDVDSFADIADNGKSDNTPAPAPVVKCEQYAGQMNFDYTWTDCGNCGHGGMDHIEGMSFVPCKICYAN